MPQHIDLSIAALRQAYLSEQLTPHQVVAHVLAQCKQHSDNPIWISLFSQNELAPYLDRLARTSPDELPLYGIPFAIKDNIDLAATPTTAACPAFSYVAEKNATVVERLIAAGAIPIGKTNLDQFATGLVGTRSPYGSVRNAFHPDYISGGSSSGSAVAVALGLVSFALGTDTAGSGRVPAAFNNLVGLKPSRGLWSTHGVVPACRSLDCVTAFTLNPDDALLVHQIASGYDNADPYSRRKPVTFGAKPRFRFGVPLTNQLEFFGNHAMRELYDQALAHLQAIGGETVAIDFQPFTDAAKLLYEGPWVAERYTAIETFIQQHADSLHPVTRAIIEPATQLSAIGAFKAQYRLQAYKQRADEILDTVDFIVTPTSGTIYTIAEANANPLQLNANLGHYTNFMNLLDYAAIALPAGMLANGLPGGITLFGPAFSDEALLSYARRYCQKLEIPMGATAYRWQIADSAPPMTSDTVKVAVCGAHLSGLPLNHQLTDRGAKLVSKTHTAPVYRLYALPDGKRPGLIRDDRQGRAIEVEVWEMPSSHFGSFVAQIPAPLGIGRLDLQDGNQVSGFICEPYIIAQATEISSYGGWRAYFGRRSFLTERHNDQVGD